MKSKRKIIFATFCILMMLQSALAFAQSTPEQRAQKWTDWMKAELQLKEEQIAQVHAVNLKYAKETENIKDKDESRKDKFGELKDQDKLKDADLKPILTEEQFKTYQEKKKAKQKEMIQKAKSKK